MTFSDTLDLDCPPTVAFDTMADVRNETDWNDGVISAEMLTSGPVREGSRFRTDHGRPLGQIESTITTYDRPGRLAYEATSSAMDLTVTFTVEESAAGTRMVGEFDPRPSGVMKLLFPLLRPMIRKDMARQHDNFVALCESRARAERA